MDQLAQRAAEGTNWRLVILIFSVGVVSAFNVGKVPPSLLLMRAELKLSLFAAGWVFSIFNLVAAGGGALAGAAADRLGHRRLALWGLAGIAVAGLAGGLARGAPGLLLSRFCEGLGYVMVGVTAPALIVGAAQKKDLGLALGIWSAFMPLGTATMMLFSPLLLSSVGWRGLWFVDAALIALMALLLLKATTRPTAAPVASGQTWSVTLMELKLTVSRPGPLLLALCFGNYALQFVSLVGFLPTILVEEVGVNQGAAAGLSALVVAMSIPGNILGGRLLQRGVRRVVLLCTAGAVVGLSSLGIYSDALPGPLRLCLCLVFSALGGMIPAALFSGTPIHAPRPSLVATTNGLMMQGASLGSTLGPPALAALVTAAGGWHSAPWLLISASGLGIASALGLGRLEGAASRDSKEPA